MQTITIVFNSVLIAVVLFFCGMNDLRSRLQVLIVNALLAVIILSCGSRNKTEVDLIVSASRIYTSDSNEVVECIVIKDGKIFDLGTKAELMKRYSSSEQIDYDGYLYPGFIDAHSHFYGYGKYLLNVDLTNTRSLDEVIERTANFAAKSTDYWIYGRGWDQTDWVDQGFPNNTKLNLLFPDRPVILRRVDGHAALANQKALDLAGITIDTKVEGGSIEIRNGMLTGILVDNAADKVLNLIGEPGRAAQIKALLLAQEKCLAAGLTTVTDAGLDLSQIMLIDSLQQAGLLNIRVYAMANPSQENFDYWLLKGPYETDYLKMCSFKLYADGALGSRGALLKKDYCDEEHHHGFFLTPPARLDSFCELLYSKGFQVNTHCIGDSANKAMLHIYGKYLKGPNNRRWRIEHAQVVSPEDRHLFVQYDIIPSVQPTHATSDMYWAEKRLCSDRMAGAYAYKSLLNLHQFLPLGTDFPIEDISPLKTFYAAVYRKNEKQEPLNGFIPEEGLLPFEALNGITIWAAYANFMDKEIGSLAKGKQADYVVLDKDLISEKFSWTIKVKETRIAGKKVY